jgi:FG-GAP-like repeat/FG-GAP repeat
MSLPFSITNYPTGISPSSVAVGDLNGDGQPDLVTANIGGDPNASPPPAGTVSVLLGSSGGTFSAATPYPTESLMAFSVAIGDLNGDGHLDLAVANFGDPSGFGQNGTVSVFLGSGGGTFSAATRYSTQTGFAGAQSVAIGDLNGDGKLDLAVADASNKVPILFGNGDGSFNVPTPPTFTGINNPGSVAIADLNGDGRLDLALANFNTAPGSAGTVTVLFGQVGGGFTRLNLPTGGPTLVQSPLAT